MGEYANIQSVNNEDRLYIDKFNVHFKDLLTLGNDYYLII